MTEVSLLPPEQIAEDNCPYCDGQEEVEARIADGSTDYIPCPHPCHRRRMTSSPTPAVLPDARALEDEWHELSARADQDTGNESEDMAAIGLRDGYEQAVQTLDVLTGGDGEFRYCTVPDDRHCPDPPAMIRRIVERATPPASDAADSEVDRLRLALNKIADLGSCSGGKTPAHKLFQQAIDIATGAL